MRSDTWRALREGGEFMRKACAVQIGAGVKRRASSGKAGVKSGSSAVFAKALCVACPRNDTMPPPVFCFCPRHAASHAAQASFWRHEADAPLFYMYVTPARARYVMPVLFRRRALCLSFALLQEILHSRPLFAVRPNTRGEYAKWT